MPARIYRPTKSATQSGSARTRFWLLEFERETAPQIEPLMGWTSSTDTRPQVRMWFATEAEAVDYARRHGLAYRVENARPETRKVLSYSDNFKSSRVGQWTH
jgi:hypothetical protein